MERKEFLNLVGISVGAIVLQNCMSGCTSKSDPAPVTPPVNPPTGGGGSTTTGLTGNAESGKTIDFVLDLNNANYSILKTNGNGKIVGSVVVARAKNGDFVALSNACPHQQTPVDYREANDDFLCSNHGSKFSLTGKVTNGPATSDLKAYKATFDKDKNTLTVKE